MSEAQKISKRTAYVAILMMGVVSMLGDIVYESGRGIAPDYLMFLGASALLVGTVSGAGNSWDIASGSSAGAYPTEAMPTGHSFLSVTG